MSKHLFTRMPTQFDIGDSAHAEWTRLTAQAGVSAARQVLDAHRQHMERVVDDLQPTPEDGGLFVTDIPGYDLSFVDLNIPAENVRAMHLVSRDAVQSVIKRLWSKLPEEGAYHHARQ